MPAPDDSLLPSLTHSLTYSLSPSLPPSLTHSLTPSLPPQLSPFTRLLMPAADDELLDYLNDDGIQIEPRQVLPLFLLPSLLLSRTCYNYCHY